MQSSANERNASLLAGYKVRAAYLRKKIICKDSANERNTSLLAGYKVSAAYLRKKVCKCITLL